MGRSGFWAVVAAPAQSVGSLQSLASAGWTNTDNAKVSVRINAAGRLRKNRATSR